MSKHIGMIGMVRTGMSLEAVGRLINLSQTVIGRLVQQNNQIKLKAKPIQLGYYLGGKNNI